MADTQAAEPQNPAEKPEKKSPIPVPYTEDERAYAGYLQSRLQLARDARNRQHDEFDGQPYLQWYESNLKGANSFISPKKNREDTTFVTGTTRQALLAMVAKINQLNLSAEAKAFDDNNHEDVHTGQAMEDILYKAGELDHDELRPGSRQAQQALLATKRAFNRH